MGDQRAVDQHVEWLTGQTIQLDHRALIELQQVADSDIGVTHFHGDRHWNIQDHVQIRPIQIDRQIARRWRAAELFHRCTRRCRLRRLRGLLPRQHGIDVVLIGITCLGQRCGPLIGQCLLLGGGVLFVCHRRSSPGFCYSFASGLVAALWSCQRLSVGVRLVPAPAGPDCPCAHPA